MSTESLYGTNLLLFFPAPWSARAEITRPRVLSDLEERTGRREDGERIMGTERNRDEQIPKKSAETTSHQGNIGLYVVTVISEKGSLLPG